MRSLGGSGAKQSSLCYKRRSCAPWSEQELRGVAEFLAGISPDIPWHISRFHPDYMATDRAATPSQLARGREKIHNKTVMAMTINTCLPGRTP